MEVEYSHCNTFKKHVNISTAVAALLNLTFLKNTYEQQLCYFYDFCWTGWNFGIISWWLDIIIWNDLFAAADGYI